MYITVYINSLEEKMTEELHKNEWLLLLQEFAGVNFDAKDAAKRIRLHPVDVWVWILAEMEGLGYVVYRGSGALRNGHDTTYALTKEATQVLTQADREAPQHAQRVNDTLVDTLRKLCAWCWPDRSFTLGEMRSHLNVGQSMGMRLRFALEARCALRIVSHETPRVFAIIWEKIPDDWKPAPPKKKTVEEVLADPDMQALLASMGDLFSFDRPRRRRR